MKVVIPGGSGQLGTVLRRELEARGHTVLILSRRAEDPSLRWDGRTDGPWMQAIDGADVVINLTGRSVNCRYHWANLNEMMNSRVDSTLAVGRAIARAEQPPRVWLQASTATIYAHTFGSPHCEAEGVLGGHEPGVPDYWGYSVNIARNWELALAASPTPHTRKVAVRTGFAMSPDRGGVFHYLLWLVQTGLSGPMAGGQQYMSWIYDRDLVRAILWLIDHDEIDGPVNVTAPEPLPQRDFMAGLRSAWGARIGLPIPRWAAALGAWFLVTDTELMFKSRRVVPQRLLDAGFEFEASRWDEAAPLLVERWRAA